MLKESRNVSVDRFAWTYYSCQAIHHHVLQVSLVITEPFFTITIQLLSNRFRKKPFQNITSEYMNCTQRMLSWSFYACRGYSAITKNVLFFSIIWHRRLFVNIGASISWKKWCHMIPRMVWQKRYNRIDFSWASGIMLWLLNEICRLCAENFEAPAQRSILDDIVDLLMMKFSTPNVRKSECIKATMHSNYSVVEHITMVQDSPR